MSDIVRRPLRRPCLGVSSYAVSTTATTPVRFPNASSPLALFSDDGLCQLIGELTPRQPSTLGRERKHDNAQRREGRLEGSTGGFRPVYQTP